VTRAAPTAEEARRVLGRFALSGPVAALEPHEGGLINFSWRATLGAPAAEERVLLQRINRHVFRRPWEVMANMSRVTRHVAAHLAAEGASELQRRVLRLVPTREGATHHVDDQGETWRLVRWIDGTRCVVHASTEIEARDTAFAFGRFLRQLSDLPGPRLHETIPGFHDTPARVHAFERIVAEDRAARAASCRPEIEAVLDRRPLAGALAARRRDGELIERPVHNDAKIANVLFDDRTGEALCVVDLDTVMPGLALHDFGDLVRSSASDSDEDERDLRRVAVRPTIYRALASGFVEGAGDALSAAERELLATGAAVIVYEQALRFLADHLDGDRYYLTTRPGHNLDRARNQLALLEDLLRAGLTARAEPVAFDGSETARKRRRTTGRTE
jgi:aminoglycoside phosphotransferase (APT) family kinase protein